MCSVPLSTLPVAWVLQAGEGEAAGPRLAHRLLPALYHQCVQCTRRAALLLSFFSSSQFYHAIKLLPPLWDKPVRRQRVRITLDQ